MTQAISILFVEDMTFERGDFLVAKPYERTPEQRGRANGFRPRTARTRIGEIPRRIPPVRNVADPLYPQAIERGGRRERTSRIALAEMYIQGDSTRKVKTITQQLCGFEVSATQTSQVTAQLDEELESWSRRALG